MKKPFPLILLLLLLPAVAAGQGVISEDVRGYGTAVEVLGTMPDAIFGQLPETLSAEDVAAALAGVPPDDSGKWELTIFTTAGCARCDRLKRDLKSDPALAAIAQWAHVNVYSMSSRSQLFRFRRYKASGTYPLITLAPPRQSQVLPYVYVVRETGYDGDARGLARRMLEAVRRFLRRFVNPAPGPAPVYPPDYDTRPSPLSPRPSPLFPNLFPNLLPDRTVIPNLPPLGPVPGQYADAAELVLITDPQSLSGRVKLLAARRAIERLQEKLKEEHGIEVNVRILKYTDVKEQYPMVQPGDLPAVVFTKGGRLAGYLSVGVLRSTDGEGVTAEDVATGGGIGVGVIVLVIIGVVLLRRRYGKARKAKAEAGGESLLHNVRPSVAIRDQVAAIKASRRAAAADEQSVRTAAEQAAEEAAAEQAAVTEAAASLGKTA